MGIQDFIRNKVVGHRTYARDKAQREGLIYEREKLLREKALATQIHENAKIQQEIRDLKPQSATSKFMSNTVIPYLKKRKEAKLTTTKINKGNRQKFRNIKQFGNTVQLGAEQNKVSDIYGGSKKTDWSRF
jgi:hypothetical protein